MRHLLECSGLSRSTYYYALAHPVKPTRPELHYAVAEIFSRTTNGCGHRQVAMCLRAELGAKIADKTVLKIMREMGIYCRIRRETDYHRYSSYKGVVGKTFENVIGRDFSADGPWKKMIPTSRSSNSREARYTLLLSITLEAKRLLHGVRRRERTWSSK